MTVFIPEYSASFRQAIGGCSLPDPWADDRMLVSLARLTMSAQQWTAPDGGGIFQKAVSRAGLRSIALVRLPIP
jgi:hypothetical protein